MKRSSPKQKVDNSGNHFFSHGSLSQAKSGCLNMIDNPREFHLALANLLWHLPPSWPHPNIPKLVVIMTRGQLPSILQYVASLPSFSKEQKLFGLGTPRSARTEPPFILSGPVQVP